MVHVSTDLACTQAEFMRAAAEAMGLDGLEIGEAAADPGGVRRPPNSRLDTALYRSLGGPPLTNYPEALASLRRRLARA